MAKRKKQNLAPFFAIPFALGLLLGFTLASVFVTPLPRLELSSDENYSSSITIVGIDKNTAAGRLGVMKVELKPGSGSVLIKVPPYENEDTQQTAVTAMTAAATFTRKNLDSVDLIVSIENMEFSTTIAGPSAGAAVALLMVSTIRASQDDIPNRVRSGVVISAAIRESGRLSPVGDISEKYNAVREVGGYSTFIVAEEQVGPSTEYSDVAVVRVRNLEDLVSLVLW